MTHWLNAPLVVALALASPAHADQASFRSLYESLVETDTSLTSGSCTVASGKMADAMIATGFSAADLHAYAVADHPKDGGLVAILPGRDARAKALLLVAHIDVVEADRAGWRYDPFLLTEADGYFHGRGVSDNKAMAAALVDMLIRMRQEGFRPKRTIKVALTCGEESPEAFNGARYLATEKRDLVDAGLALVPSAGAALDDRGRHVAITLQAGEKIQQNFRVEAAGIGSHASRPTKDNAIYRLAEALVRLNAQRFPVALNPVTRRYFAIIAKDAAPVDAAAIEALLAHPADAAAQEVVSANPAWNAMLRTTCVATTIDTGRQANTIAPHASANINCRLLPDARVADVQAAITGWLSGPGISVAPSGPLSPESPAPAITPDILAPIARLSGRMWPGVAVIPAMLTGATDARHLNAAGIPAYGLTVTFSDPDGGNVHAVNERIRVRSVYEGREFIYRLARLYASR